MYTGKHRAFPRAFGTLSLLIALAMVVGLLAGTGGGAVAHTQEDPLVTDLIAGGGNPKSAIDVGDILVWNDGDNLYVKYVIDDPDWCITETHLHVATSPDLIPQKNGNPPPGQFDYSAIHDCVTEYTYTVPLNGWTVDTDLFIAAHAVVRDKTSETSTAVFSSTNTDITEVNGTPVTAKAVSANEPFNYPNCASYTPDDTSKSVWDNGIGAAFDTFAAAPAADWIWNTLDPEHTILGDVVQFQETFSVPGLPVGGTLYITADNGYKAMLNGTDLGSAQLGAGFPGTLKETLSTPPPQQGDWGVASQGWQSVEAYSLSGLVSGDNTLMITAANEYMWNDGGYSGPDYYYGSWDPSGGSVNDDPFPGTGIGGDGICRNPAGLIFKATVDYYARNETAWGAGLDFPGRNWATYISYTVQGEIPVEWPEGGTTTVAFEDLPLAGANDWDYNDWVADIDVLATYFGTSAELRDLTQMDFAVTPQAKLAGYTHQTHLAVDTIECDGTYELYRDGSLVESGNYVDGTGIDVVLVPNTGAANSAHLTISFDPPCAFDFSAFDPYSSYHGEGLFFDPYIKVNNTGEEIHQGDVRMLVVPVDWQWPTPDGNAIWNPYPKVTAGNPPTFQPYWWTP